MDWILCLIAGALAGSLVSMTGSGAGFLLAPGLSVALSFGAFPDADCRNTSVSRITGTAPEPITSASTWPAPTEGS